MKKILVSLSLLFVFSIPALANVKIGVVFDAGGKK